MGPASRPKQWVYPCVLTEHVFDKVRSLDMNLAEFEAVLTGTGEVIEESLLADGLKEVVLLIDWRQPLHVVVVVDDEHREERVVTVYEPAPDRWSDDYRRRR